MLCLLEGTMRRTEQRQGLRMLKLRDVMSRWEAGGLSQLEAAELLGMSERTFRRWSRRFEEDGEDGFWTGAWGGAPAGRFLTTRPRRSSGFTASATPVSRPSISTSALSGIMASAGATRGPRPIF